MVELNSELIEYLEERTNNMQKYRTTISDCLSRADSRIMSVAEETEVEMADEYLLGRTSDHNCGYERYYLSIRSKHGTARGGLYFRVVSDYADDDYICPWDAPYFIQLNAVCRLTEFITNYTRKVLTVEDKYKTGAELAKSIDDALTHEPRYRKYGSQYKLE